MRNRKSYLIIFLMIGLCINSCVEPFDVKSIAFESVLIVKATISDEVKHQQIKLSKTFQLDETGPSFEKGADVQVVDNNGQVFTFHEITPGTYLSDMQFGAIKGTDYQLKIVTDQGRSYSSQLVQLTNTSKIDSVYAESSDDGNGVNIFVDSYNPKGDSRYYKYEYEETYKIIAPKWTYKDLVVKSEDPPEFEFVPRDENTRVCYNTIYSDGIIQTETNNFNEDRITRFLVRSISVDNFIISHRYSILVKQYVQSLEAYTFYKTLKDLSGSESIFSQNQPGFFDGNIRSDNNPDEIVVGFFEVCSVSSKRIFFNSVDLHLNLSYPRPYPGSCEYFAPETEPLYGKTLFDYIEENSLKYYTDNDGKGLPVIPPGGPFVMVPYACGDCTVLGTNVVPDFWEE